MRGLAGSRPGALHAPLPARVPGVHTWVSLTPLAHPKAVATQQRHVAPAPPGAAAPTRSMERATQEEEDHSHDDGQRGSRGVQEFKYTMVAMRTGNARRPSKKGERFAAASGARRSPPRRSSGRGQQQQQQHYRAFESLEGCALPLMMLGVAEKPEPHEHLVASETARSNKTRTHRRATAAAPAAAASPAEQPPAQSSTAPLVHGGVLWPPTPPPPANHATSSQHQQHHQQQQQEEDGFQWDASAPDAPAVSAEASQAHLLACARALRLHPRTLARHPELRLELLRLRGGAPACARQLRALAAALRLPPRDVLGMVLAHPPLLSAEAPDAAERAAQLAALLQLDDDGDGSGDGSGSSAKPGVCAASEGTAAGGASSGRWQRPSSHDAQQQQGGEEAGKAHEREVEVEVERRCGPSSLNTVLRRHPALLTAPLRPRQALASLARALHALMPMQALARLVLAHPWLLCLDAGRLRAGGDVAGVVACLSEELGGPSARSTVAGLLAAAPELLGRSPAALRACCVALSVQWGLAAVQLAEAVEAQPRLLLMAPGLAQVSCPVFALWWGRCCRALGGRLAQVQGRGGKAGPGAGPCGVRPRLASSLARRACVLQVVSERVKRLLLSSRHWFRDVPRLTAEPRVLAKVLRFSSAR